MVKKKHKDWFDENHPELLKLLDQKREVEGSILSKTQSPEKVQISEIKKINGKSNNDCNN